MRYIDAYTADDNVEPNVGPFDKTFCEPSGPHTKSTPNVPTLENFVNDTLNGKDVVVDSSSEKEP